MVWRHRYYGNGGGGGLLTTAGGLLFAGDGAGSLVAHDAATGKPLMEHPDRTGHQSAADVHDRWEAVPDRSYRRHALVVFFVLRPALVWCYRYLGE